MEFPWLFIIIISYCLLLVLFVLKILFHYWWIPRRIETHFLKQGIRGPKYHFFLGNLREVAGLMLKSASSDDHHRPLLISLSSSSSYSPHNILPRVLSFYYHWKKIYGTYLLVSYIYIYIFNREYYIVYV